MNWIAYFMHGKPKALDMKGQDSIDLSGYDFQPEDKLYLCRYRDFFRIESHRICALYNIKLDRFKRWKDRCGKMAKIANLDALDILKYGDSDVTISAATQTEVEVPLTQTESESTRMNSIDFLMTTESDCVCMEVSAPQPVIPAKSMQEISSKSISNTIMNPLDIHMTCASDCVCMDVSPSQLQATTREISTQTVSESIPITTRKKRFEEYHQKYRNTILQELHQSLIRSPILSGFEQTEKERAIQLFAERYANRKVETTAEKELTSLLKTFTTAIELAVRYKDMDRLSQILSLLFSSLTLKQVQERVYPITPYHWNRGHRHLLAFGAGAIPIRLFTRSYSSVNETSVRDAVSWLFSKKYYRSTAYGTQTHRLSDGSKITTPQYVTGLTKIKLYTLYRETDLPFKLAKKSFYLLLDLLGKNKDKLLAALDTAAMKLGEYNFSNMIQFILRVFLNIDNNNMETVVKAIEKVRDYLKHDYRSHLTENNLCCFGNYRYLFGENSVSSSLTSTCVCESCQSVFNLIDELETIVSTCPINPLIPDTREDLQIYLSRLLRNMTLYIAHLARCEWERLSLRRMMESLEPDEFLVVSDWKMKILMLLYRESMQSFFGKRGISLLGFAIVRKKTNGEFQIDFHDYLTDDGCEDSLAVMAGISALFKSLEANPEFDSKTKFRFYSDGAPCFSSNPTLHFLSKTGTISRFVCIESTISEAGEGKTFLDAHFSYLMTFLKNSVLEGKGTKNVISADTAAIALARDEGIKNTTTYVFSLNRKEATVPSIQTIPALNSYHSRLMYYNDRKELVGMTLRRFHSRSHNEWTLSLKELRSYRWTVGSTMNIPYESVKQQVERPRLQEEVPGVIGQKRKFHDAVDDLPMINPENRMHCCPDPDCAAMYCHESGLRDHLAAGGHYYGITAAIHTKKEQPKWNPPKKRNSPERSTATMIHIINDFNQHHSIMETEEKEEEEDYLEDDDDEDSATTPRTYTAGQRYFPAGFGPQEQRTDTTNSQPEAVPKVVALAWR